MGARMRAKDWAKTPLGPPQSWPQSLKTAVRILLDSRYAMWMSWGEQRTFFCNDAYLPTVGVRRDWVLGAPAQQVWAEIWPEIGPRIDFVVETGQSTWDEGLLLFLQRSGYTEETYHTFSYSPLYDDGGAIGGHLCVVTEETERIIGERRVALLRDLAAGLAAVQTEADVLGVIKRCLEPACHDLPFAMVYLFDHDEDGAQRAALSGISADHPAAPPRLDNDEIWPVSQVLAQAARGNGILVEKLHERFDDRPKGPWDDPVTQAVVVPIGQRGQARPAGVFIAGLNPYRLFDETYRGFVGLFVGQIAAGLANVRAYEAERRRAESLAELDRAKTVFFSNVSHEFRTPLTLMIGPLEDALRLPGSAISKPIRGDLEVAFRNSLRLLKLVNALLDFSRIEAGRMEAAYEPLDLAAYTAELASSFRSAVERAGLRLVIDCPPLAEPVYVDRVMWEKVVFNLLSNAFKHTFDGAIEVRMRSAADHVELAVRDSGAGIPADMMPRLFERFFRVEGARSRSHEGSGIGLSMVDELVKLHGGRIRAESALGEGSTFIVTIPRGRAHLPQDRVNAAPHRFSTALGADIFVGEALSWITAEATDPGRPTLAPSAEAEGNLVAERGARIVLADDNADMREYVGRLLSPHYRIETVPDGVAALAAIRREKPDLVLSDVMMPKLDGFQLLNAIRSDPALADVPVVMVSARAGEESRVEGLDAGADDYLVKPFSARELLARVGATVSLSRLRRQGQAALTESEERYRQLVQALPGALYTTDAQGRITLYNPAAADLWGRTPEVGEDLWCGSCRIYRPDGTLLSPEEYPTARVVRGEKPAHGDEIILERPDGSRRHVLPHVEPILDSAGAIVGAVNMLVDITEHRRAEQELQQAKDAAEAANRSKDKFLAVLSHELRTPLTPVLLAVAGLESDADLPLDVREDLSMIRRNVELETRLIDDLLDLSRITTGKLQLRMQPVDLAAKLQHVCGICRPQILEKGIHLHVTLDEKNRRVTADPARLQQILWNLLKNATKFTPAGGTIHVRLRNVPPDRVRVEVEDSGIGIEADVLPRIFDAFEQGDRNITRQFGGLGLGLAISKALVEFQHGTIRAESAGAAMGATFIVELPVEAAPAASDALRGAGDAPGRHQHLRVLVVEDHPDSARIIARVLQSAGYSVKTAHTAAAALDLAAQEVFDIVVSDIGLPDGTGYELMQQLRARREVKGIAMSGYGMDEDLRRSREAGFSEHLVKPILAEQIEQAIGRVMGLPS
jgi:PAS domain S-box-containing protein